MDYVKYTPVIGKYTRNPASKPRQVLRLRKRCKADVLEWLGAAGTFVLYFAVMLWALMGAVAR